MKKIMGVFVFAANIMMVFAQSWTDAVTSLTIGTNYSFTSATDKNGIHVLYYYNGTLKYGRINSAGSTIISDVTVATGIGNYAAITTYNNKIYAVYEKNTDIYIAKSTDGGSNWSAALDEYSRTNTFESLSAISDDKGVHVVWSEYNSNEAFYALAKVNASEPVWDYFKEVSDYGYDTGKNPSVAVSAEEVHVTYQQVSGYAKTRDFLISESTPSWEDPVTLQSYPGGIAYYNKTMVIGDNIHVVCLEWYYYGMYSYCKVRHYIRDVYSTSYSSSTLSDEYYGNGPNFHLTITNNGDLHLLYNKRYYNTSIHVKYDGDSWSTVDNDLVWNNRNHLTSAGNDLYLIQEDYGYSDKLSLRQYDAAPVTPINFQNAASSGNVQISWSANPEPDIECYEIERKLGTGSWTVIATQTGTTFTDYEIEYDPNPNTHQEFEVIAYYRIRAKSVEDEYSSYSNTVTINGISEPEKRGYAVQEIIEFSMGQNYPNPFNPSTTINYSIPEPTNVRINVFDHIGREVASVLNTFHNAGNYSATFDASKLASGLYFYKITAGRFIETKRMLLLK